MQKKITLGKDIESGQEVYLVEEARKLSTYILGKIGVGKSTLLEAMAYQDMLNGDGLCFIDPHEDSAEKLLLLVPASRAREAIFYDPTDVARPFGINPFYCPDPTDPLKATSQAENFVAALGSLAEFSGIFESAPRMRNVLHNLALTFVVNQGYTLAETPEFLTNETFRQKFYDALLPDHYPIRAFWERLDKRNDKSQMELVESSLNKLERFSSNPVMRAIFGQPIPSIDYRQAMDAGKIILVKLSDKALGEDNAAFIGAFIVFDIFQALLSRADTPEGQRKQFHLIADEFQRFMTTTFPRLQAESRKFGVDTTVAHQTRAQLTDPKSRAATLVVGNKVFFTLTGQDAAELAKEFDVTPPAPASSGQREKLAPTLDPLGYLKQHSSSDIGVQSGFSELRDVLAKRRQLLVSELQYLLERAKESSNSRVEARIQQRLAGVDNFMEETERKLSEWLHERMFGYLSSDEGRLMDLVDEYFAVPTGESNWDDFRLGAKVIAKWQLQQHDLEESQREWAEEKLKLYAEDLATYASHFGVAQRFFEEAMKLGDALEKHPIMVGTGEYEPIPEKPRAYADVEAEVANKLGNLPRSTARVKIVTAAGTPKEFTIQTSRLDTPEDVKSQQLARKIREESRERYGRDRGDVERGIVERLHPKPKSRSGAAAGDKDEPIIREKA